MKRNSADMLSAVLGVEQIDLEEVSAVLVEIDTHDEIPPMLESAFKAIGTDQFRTKVHQLRSVWSMIPVKFNWDSKLYLEINSMQKGKI